MRLEVFVLRHPERLVDDAISALSEDIARVVKRPVVGLNHILSRVQIGSNHRQVEVLLGVLFDQLFVSFLLLDFLRLELLVQLLD